MSAGAGTSADGAGSVQVSVVVVHWNTPALLSACVAAVPVGLAGLTHEIIVVDNGSAADRRPRPEDAASVTLIRNAHNRGFAAAANQGAALARGELVLFLNSDAVLLAGTVRALRERMRARPWLAAVAPVALDGAGRPRPPGLCFLTPLNQAAGLLGIGSGRGGRADRRSGRQPAPAVAEADWLRASVLLVRTAALRAVGGFDEGYGFYEEDEDLCWRLRRRGYALATCHDVAVSDPGGGSVAHAGPWPEASLYGGQLRFLGRRYGPLGQITYRLAVSVAVAAKLLVAALPLRRPRAAAPWTPSRVVTILARLWLGRSPAGTPRAGSPPPKTALGSST